MQRKSIRSAVVSAFLGALICAAAPMAQTGRPMELADILAWKSIALTVVSNDGRFFAYRQSPVQGDSDIVIRSLDSENEWRFAIGETPQPAGPGGPQAPADTPPAPTLAFSSDSKWAAFTVYPTRAEAARLRRQRRPLQNSVRIVNLASGTSIDVAKVKRFEFAGDRGGWIALHRYGPEPPQSGQNAATGGTANQNATTPRERDRTRPSGSDLLLRELVTGVELNLGNVSDFAFNKAGMHLAWTVDAQDRAGNSIVVRDMASGRITPLDSGNAWYERPAWSEDGDAVAVLKGVENRGFRDPNFSLLGFTGLGSASSARIDFDPSRDAAFPSGMTISPNRRPQWTDDKSAILFGIHKPRRRTETDRSDARNTDENPREGSTRADAAPGDTDDERPNLVIWHWLDRRLQSQQQVEEARDRSFSYLSEYRVADKKFVRLADEELRDVTSPVKGAWAVGFDRREYDLMGSLDGRRYEDVYAVDLTTGARKLAVKRVRYYSGQAPSAGRFLYYDDGHYFVHEMATGQTTNITRTVPTSFINTHDDRNVIKPPLPAVGWTSDSSAVLLADEWDLWRVPVSGNGATNLTVTGRKNEIHYRRPFTLDPDQKGFDLSAPLYVDAYGEWTKKGGIARIDAAKPGAQALVWDDAAFGRLIKAKHADVYLYTRESFTKAPEYYVANASLENGRKVTDVGKQQTAFLWSSGVILVDYMSAKGDKLQATLRLPANYEKGKTYPTIVQIYERLSQGHNQFTTPTANGFNASAYTSNGYAVLQPDIAYRVNDPGMSAVWCVLPALNAAIATGVVDKGRVALHGHSWGGYQTAFLITQTNAFKAAIAGAPLTDMISMYSLIYKNTGGTNQAIFESSQGRFFGGYWDNQDAYIRNSPVYFAKNVSTPLMILHNDADGAVDFTQGVEYFNTLRRLRKPVVMLEYPGENHNLRRPANQQDYTVRMREFFDHYLKGGPAPKWLKDGIPRLDMEEYLKEQTQPKKTTTDVQSRQ